MPQVYDVGQLAPSYSNGFAYSAGESLYPDDRNKLQIAYTPSLGITGDNIPDMSGNRRDMKPNLAAVWNQSNEGGSGSSSYFFDVPSVDDYWVPYINWGFATLVNDMRFQGFSVQMRGRFTGTNDFQRCWQFENTGSGQESVFGGFNRSGIYNPGMEFFLRTSTGQTVLAATTITTPAPNDGEWHTWEWSFELSGTTGIVAFFQDGQFFNPTYITLQSLTSIMNVVDFFSVGAQRGGSPFGAQNMEISDWRLYQPNNHRQFPYAYDYLRMYRQSTPFIDASEGKNIVGTPLGNIPGSFIHRPFEQPFQEGWR